MQIKALRGPAFHLNLLAAHSFFTKPTGECRYTRRSDFTASHSIWEARNSGKPRQGAETPRLNLDKERRHPTR
jgi:hypothetical protein